MAIQKINLGTAPTGAGGDTQRSANQKINANFSNPDHAASRMVGTDGGDVMEVGAFGIGRPLMIHTPSMEIDNVLSNMVVTSTHTKTPGSGWIQSLPWAKGTGQLNKQVWHESYGFGMSIRQKTSAAGEYSDWKSVAVIGDNVTVDSNGIVKAASPVLQVYSDKITGNYDGERMKAEFNRNGVGDYTISKTTGLAENGWYITLPNDLNGNPKVAVTLEESNGIVSLKTYKRIFNMETFAFGPDLDNPLDIPEGRWIDLRFNDLPQPEIEPETGV